MVVGDRQKKSDASFWIPTKVIRVYLIIEQITLKYEDFKKKHNVRLAEESQAPRRDWQEEKVCS